PASGNARGVGAAVPRPARSHADASPTLFPRPAPGWRPARAGAPLVGRVSHPLDDTQSFMKSSHPPIPFDPQGLVALQFLYAIRPIRLMFFQPALARCDERVSSFQATPGVIQPVDLI